MLPTSHFHPMTVHFPIAIVLIGFLVDIASIIFKKEKWLSKAGFYLMIIGTLSAIAAFLTGEFLTKEFSGAASELKERHELFAKIAMWILIVGSALRVFLVYRKMDESPLKWLVFLLYAIAAISVGIAGYLGGSLVYDYMVGL